MKSLNNQMFYFEMSLKTIIKYDESLALMKSEKDLRKRKRLRSFCYTLIENHRYWYDKMLRDIQHNGLNEAVKERNFEELIADALNL